MAYATYSLNKIQLGRESTAGTAVAATKVFRGSFAMLEDARTINVVDEQIGLLVPAERAFTSAYLGRLSMPNTPLTTLQVCDILEAGVETVTPGGAGPYTYTYNFPTGTTLNTIKTYTIEAGNASVTSDVREMEYSFVEEFEFSANAGEAWQMSANWVGRQLSSSTFTAALTAPSVTELILPRTKLYIDATGGTVGSTQVSGVLMGAQMNVTTGIMPVPVGDGNLYFSGHKFTAPTITFSLTMELENTADAVATERAIYESQAVRLFHLQLNGGSDANNEMTIEWAGKYDSISDYQNSNGNTTVTFEGHAVYSSTDSLFWEAAVTNTAASL
jgi:hypothetical protein